MKNLKSIFSIMLFVVAVGFSACTEDPTMDDVLNTAEINSPAPSNDGQGGGGGDGLPPGDGN